MKPSRVKNTASLNHSWISSATELRRSPRTCSAPVSIVARLTRVRWVGLIESVSGGGEIFERSYIEQNIGVWDANLALLREGLGKVSVSIWERESFQNHPIWSFDQGDSGGPAVWRGDGEHFFTQIGWFSSFQFSNILRGAVFSLLCEFNDFPRHSVMGTRMCKGWLPWGLHKVTIFTFYKSTKMYHVLN